MKAILFTILLLPTLAFGDTVLGYTLEHDGNFYSVTVNEDGAVLKSGHETVYVGKNCDAISDSGEVGRWYWSNAGWAIEFPQRRMSWARTEAPVKYPNECGL